MKKREIILGLLIGSFVLANAQTSVVEKSGKKPDWPFQLEKGFIVGIGNAETIQQAKENAMLNVKAQIVTSVADNITSSSELKNTEITSDNVAKSFQSYSDIITSKSGKQDYLVGVSQANISEIYWEKSVDKKTKTISYQYYIKYPFSSFDLMKLVDDFKAKDQEMTDELQKALDRLDNFTSTEDIYESQSVLASLYKVFIDQRKTKAKVGLERCVRLLESVLIQNDGSTLGIVRYGLYIDGKRVTSSAKPVISSECAVIEDKKFGGEVCELRYRYDECYGDGDSKIKVSYTFGNKKTDKLFFFDINENKADLNLIGTIRLGEGTIEGEEVLNAKCKIEISSKFDSPVTIINIVFEWKQYAVVCDIPVNETISGKGVHELEFSIPRLPVLSVSTATHPENKLNGSITYSSASGSQKNKIRIYQKDYVTAW
ncbi:MAG: hypothetical protein WC542_02875 [Paludibacter sp.]|jgi:hypothetical protein